MLEMVYPRKDIELPRISVALDGCQSWCKIASLSKNLRRDFPYSESASSFSPTSSLRCVCPPAELRVGMKEADKKFAAETE